MDANGSSGLQMKPHHQPAKSTKLPNTVRSGGGGKSKKKPIKVVYISNPKKVTASASEFRALVQQLTGQDADDDLQPDLHPTTSNPMSSRSRRQPDVSSTTQYYDEHYLYDDYDDVDGLLVPAAGMLADSFVPAADQCHQG